MSSNDQAMQALWIERQDANAFTELVQRHAGMVYATCRRVLGNAGAAEDVAQECFMELARQRSVVAPSLGGWLHRVAVLRSRNRIRGDKRRSAREMRYALKQGAAVEPVWDDVKPHLDEAIAALPERLRTPVVQRFLEGRTQEQVARDLGVARSTAQHRIERGVEAIRRFLRKRGIVASSALLASLLTSNAVEAAPSTLVASLGERAVAGHVSASAGASVPTISFLSNGLGKGIVVAAAVSLGLWGASRAFWTKPEASPSEGETTAVSTEEPPRESFSTSSVGLSADSSPEPASTPVQKTRQGGAVSGRVYASHSGEGVPYITVVARPKTRNDRGDTEWPQTRTNSEGDYQFEELAEGDYVIDCCDQNLMFSRTLSGGRSMSPIPGGVSVSVSVREGGDYARKDICFDLADAVSGHVLGPDSRPVPHATVWIHADEGAQTYWSKQETNAEGGFLFVQLRTDARACLQAAKGSLASRVIGPLTVPDGGLTGLRLHLAPGASIAGVVLDPSGKPVPEAKGLMRHDVDKEVRPCFLRADEKGRFHVAGLSPGKYDVLLAPMRVQKTDERTDKWHFFVGSLSLVFSDPTPVATLSLSPGEHRDNLKLQFRASGIKGLVTDTEGRPVPGASVTLMYGAKTITDENGRYELVGVREGLHKVYVSHKDYLSERLDEVSSGSSNADFALVRRGTIEGRVVDARSGRPITEFGLHQSADTPYTSSMNRWFKDMNAPDGRFTLKPAIPARRIFIRSEGYAVNSVLVSDVAGKDTVVSVTVPLKPTAPVRGSVCDEKGAPVAGAFVFQDTVPYEGRHREESALARSDDEGIITLSFLPEYPVELVAWHPRLGYGWCNAVAGETLRIVLTGSGAVAGQLTDNGQPIPGIRISSVSFLETPDIRAFRQPTYLSSAVTDDNGLFRIDDLPPGYAQVHAEVGKRSIHADIEVAADMTTDIDLAFSPGAASLEGRVYLLPRMPATEGRVGLQVCTGAGTEVYWREEIDPSGAYRFESIAAGEASLSVYLTQGAPQHVEGPLQIEPGAHVVHDIHLEDAEEK